MGLSTKVNVQARLIFELTYFHAALKHLSYYTEGSLLYMAKNEVFPFSIKISFRPFR